MTPRKSPSCAEAPVELPHAIVLMPPAVNDEAAMTSDNATRVNRGVVVPLNHL